MVDGVVLESNFNYTIQKPKPKDQPLFDLWIYSWLTGWNKYVMAFWWNAKMNLIACDITNEDKWMHFCLGIHFPSVKGCMVVKWYLIIVFSCNCSSDINDYRLAIIECYRTLVHLTN